MFFKAPGDLSSTEDPTQYAKPDRRRFNVTQTTMRLSNDGHGDYERMLTAKAMLGSIMKRIADRLVFHSDSADQSWREDYNGYRNHTLFNGLK